MYGWRGRIGFILPSSNTVVENEVPKLVPEGISAHFARLPVVRHGGSHSDELLEMARTSNLEIAAQTLSDARSNAIIYACTSGSLLGGPALISELEARIRDAANNTPAFTTATAVLAFSKELAAKHLAVVTPYEPEIHNATKDFLQDNGIDVITLIGLEDLHWRPAESKSDMNPRLSYLLGKKAIAAGNADALFISCTAFRTLESVPMLMRDFNVPVFSANHASVWMALQAVGLQQSPRQYLQNFVY